MFCWASTQGPRFSDEVKRGRNSWMVNVSQHQPGPASYLGPAGEEQVFYFTGIITCSYDVPGNMTYGLSGASAVFGKLPNIPAIPTIMT